MEIRNKARLVLLALSVMALAPVVNATESEVAVPGRGASVPTLQRSQGTRRAVRQDEPQIQPQAPEVSVDSHGGEVVATAGIRQPAATAGERSDETSGETPGATSDATAGQTPDATAGKKPDATADATADATTLASLWNSFTQKCSTVAASVKNEPASAGIATGVAVAGLFATFLAKVAYDYSNIPVVKGEAKQDFGSFFRSQLASTDLDFGMVVKALIPVVALGGVGYTAWRYSHPVTAAA